MLCLSHPGPGARGPPPEGTGVNSAISEIFLKMHISWAAWLDDSVEHVTLDLGLLSSSPTLDVELT